MIMIKTTFYRYECPTCGYIITRSEDVGELKCKQCEYYLKLHKKINELESEQIQLPKEKDNG